MSRIRRAHPKAATLPKAPRARKTRPPAGRATADVDTIEHVGNAAPAKKLDADVIVVGAGWSGLKAARTLMNAGVSTMVLEAREEVGGRVRTDHETFTVPFDIGGAWIHSTVDDKGHFRNPLAAVAQRANVELRETALDRTLYVNGREATPKELAEYQKALEENDDALDRAARHGHDVRAGPLLRHGDTIAEAAAANDGPLDMGWSLDSMSAQDVGAAEMTRHDALPQGGMAAVLKADVGNVPVNTRTPVTKVKWSGDGVEVTTSRGQTLRARRVLLTVTPAMLYSGKIAFDPPLPEWKKEALRALPMGLLDKIAIEFDTNVFHTIDGKEQPADDWVMDAESDGSPPMAFLMRPMGSNLAVGFVGGKDAARLERAGKDVALNIAMGKLRRIFGPNIDAHVKKTAVTQWGKDEWTLGSYAYARPGMAHMRAKLAKALDDRVYFAGEATTDARDAQMVHGARRSGMRAAHALIASLRAEGVLPGPHAGSGTARRKAPAV
jgi:monoamine oxidase